MLGWLVRLIAVIIGSYIALVGAMHMMQRSFMYYPCPVVISPARSGIPEMQEVHLLSSDDLILTSWYAAPHAGQPVLLYFHGNTGNIATRAFKSKPFLKYGYGVMLVGYRGYGANPGTPTEAGLHADAKAAFDYLLDQGIPQNQVVIYGESLGSGVAVNLAASHHPGALILEAAFTSAVDVARLTYWYLPLQQLMKDRFDSYSHIKDIGAPLLMLHGEKDDVVPIALGRQLFTAAVEPKEFAAFPDGMHANLHEYATSDYIIAFIRQYLRSNR